MFVFRTAIKSGGGQTSQVGQMRTIWLWFFRRMSVRLADGLEIAASSVVGSLTLNSAWPCKWHYERPFAYCRIASDTGFRRTFLYAAWATSWWHGSSLRVWEQPPERLLPAALPFILRQRSNLAVLHIVEAAILRAHNRCPV